jgi:hypothetical protein
LIRFLKYCGVWASVPKRGKGFSFSGLGGKQSSELGAIGLEELAEFTEDDHAAASSSAYSCPEKENPLTTPSSPSESAITAVQSTTKVSVESL